MTNDAQCYQAVLVHQNREKIEVAAVKAIEQRLENPVVLVLDPGDNTARAIANQSGRESQIDAWVAEYERRGVVAILTWALPARVVCSLLAASDPWVAEAITPLSHPRSYYIVIVASGITVLEEQLP